jgi:hypothetical protein
MSRNDQKGNLVSVSPMTEIASVIEAEAANLRASQAVLGERRKLAADVLGLYSLISGNVAPSMAANEEEVGALLVMSMLLSGCRFQFTMSVLQNWRGRTSEALAPLRRASELCASACHIRNNPALADVWSSASDSDEAYKRHKEAFKLRFIFPKTDPTLGRLFSVFDLASKVIHCSIFSIAGQARDLSFRYFDIKGPRDPALIRTFIYILGAHELMVRAFAGAFKGFLKDEAAVDQEFRVFSERLQRHRDANRAFAMSDISQEALRKIAKKKI